jgi:hypothetical protein
MNIQEKKRKIKYWTDFYGGEIIDPETVEKARTNVDLERALNYHARHLEDMAIDARVHLDKFKKELKLW